MTLSQDLFERAQRVIPGGVNSPVRACRSVDSSPLFIAKAEGCRLWTEDGTELVDYVMSWGPMLLGHCHPGVREAVHAAVDKGSSYGAPCRAEVDLAEAVCAAFPAMDMVRMVNSGTEATMSALRLARAVTGRNKIIKFEGCYHGHADAFLASAGSGVASLCIPGTPGVPAETVEHTLLAPYNNPDRVEALFEANRDSVAALIVEPVAGNMGCVLPGEGFLSRLREMCTRHGALLIFDEVITGLRVAYGGAQARFDITPDLTCLGKIIGGGFPVGAYGGKKVYMERIAPSGDVYQAGTLSGNPVAMAAGLATMRALSTTEYGPLEERTQAFAARMADILRGKGYDIVVNGIASLATLFFAENEVTDFESAKRADHEAYIRFYKHLRDQGVNLAPSGYECLFTSFAHDDAALDKTLTAVESFPSRR